MKTAIPATGQLAEQKTIEKLALQQKLGWVPEARRPLICIPTGVSDELGGALLQDVLPGLLQIRADLLVLGKGSASYGKMLTELAKEHGDRIAIIPAEEGAMRAMYLASDIALFLADPQRLPERTLAQKSGVIPVAPACDALQDYHPNQESGNAFIFTKKNPWHCFAAVVRALETYRFPYDWKNIQKSGMQS